MKQKRYQKDWEKNFRVLLLLHLRKKNSFLVCLFFFTSKRAFVLEQRTDWRNPLKQFKQLFFFLNICHGYSFRANKNKKTDQHARWSKKKHVFVSMLNKVLFSGFTEVKIVVFLNYDDINVQM